MIRSTVIRLLRVPPEPDPPPGTSEQLRTFRAAANFLRYRMFEWTMGQIGALIGLIIATLAIREAPSAVYRFLMPLELLGWLGFVAQLPFTLAIIRLDYDLRWYMVSDRSLRIREGITTVKEKTMTFANIQNISVRQGPLQRLLRIADLEVQTAGGGGVSAQEEGGGLGESLHVARFRGVDNASEIRELILSRVRKQKDSGLGDPDEARSLPHSTGEADAVHAARDVLEEARKLRAALRERVTRRAGE